MGRSYHSVDFEHSEFRLLHIASDQVEARFRLVLEKREQNGVNRLFGHFVGGGGGGVYHSCCVS